MNKKTQTLVATTLALVLTLTFGLSNVFGQNIKYKRSLYLPKQNDNADAIVGTWVATVTMRNCQTGEEIRSFPVLNTFNQGGTMMETPRSLAARSPGHGNWVRSRGNEYISIFMFFRSNPDGTDNGFQKILRYHTLSNDGTMLITRATFDNFNPSGVITSSGCATETATRLIQ